MKYKNKKKVGTLVKKILAGAIVAIAGIVYLSVENKVIGSFLFSTALLVVIKQGLYLYTGKIGFLFDGESKTELLKALVLNFAGSILIGLLIGFTRVAPSLVDTASKMVEAKLSQSLLSAFILSVFCGVMMKIAVMSKSDLITVLCIMVFILSGFEHCVANIFYFTVAGSLTKCIPHMIVMILGNTVGSNLWRLSLKKE